MCVCVCARARVRAHVYDSLLYTLIHVNSFCVCAGHVGAQVTCNAPSVEKGQTVELTCDFQDNMQDIEADLAVRRYVGDSTDAGLSAAAIAAETNRPCRSHRLADIGRQTVYIDHMDWYKQGDRLFIFIPWTGINNERLFIFIT